MSNSDTAIRAAVDAFVEQLSGLIRQAALESVQALLSDGAAPSRHTSKVARGSVVAVRGRRKGAKRTPIELEALVKKFHAHVVKNPGQRIEQIGQILAIPTKELALPVKRLMSEKKLSSKGQKRATTYFAK
jgi:hypothetical protein